MTHWFLGFRWKGSGFRRDGRERAQRAQRKIFPLRPLRFFAADDSVVGLAALDFNLVGVRVELGTEAEGFALQDEVDEFEGLSGLLLGGTSRDLAGVELKVEPASKHLNLSRSTSSVPN